MDITQTIEKMIRDLLKSERGDQIAALYLRYANPLNFTLVIGIGALMYFMLAALWYLSLPITWIWMWSMTVGPLGHLWGFKKRLEKKDNKQQKDIKQQHDLGDTPL